MPTRPPRELRGPARVIDLIVGIALTVIGAGVGLIMLSFITQLGGLSKLCEGIEPDGVVCSPEYLSGMSLLGTAVVVLGWALPAGFLLVRAIRRQLVFWLPILSIVVMIVGWYVVVAALAAYQPAA